MIETANWVRAGLLAGCCALQACAVPVRPEPPVCGDPGVLQQVNDIMASRGRPLTLDSVPAGEMSTDATQRAVPLAHCSVRAHSGAGSEPFIVSYTIELRQPGMLVRVD